ncbi:MAG: hypothetical protein ACJ75G_00380 [Gaiellaceae bacterium]
MSFAATSIAAVAVVSASGAATAKASKVIPIDVSTRTAVVHYLRSIDVDPTAVVIQRGARNYAGPSCPGEGWSCTTTAHPVVQVASADGSNTFNCTTATCAVVQVAAAPLAPNTAKCIRTTGLSQSCTISQSSSTRDNLAIVYESATKTSGLTQTASSFASITQVATGASNSNTACVTQNITIDGSTVARRGTPVTVTLEAHQTATIKQDATGSGANSAEFGANASGNCTTQVLGQNQTLTSKATGSGPITQNENAANSGANLTIDIEQNQGTGNGVGSGLNTANFAQTNTLTAIANSPSGPISQTQSSVNGGLLGTVNQDSSGISTADATQTETQCEDAATSGLATCDTSDPDAAEAPASLTQTQIGPLHKGVGTATQTGNPGDTFSINQTSTQDDDQGSGSNQTNLVQGDCSTPGNCTVVQTTDIDGQQNTNTQSGQDVDTTTTCSGSECTSTGPSLTFLENGLSVSNTDVGEFGQGGMRGDGTGSIDVSGITGPVFRAFLYWHGPTNSSDPNSNATVTFNGSSVTGTNIGTAFDNNWGFDNSQAYRADVTALVSGDGTYSLGDFVKTGDGTIADINGVALIVFHNDGNASDDRDVVLWNGNDSNQPSEFDSDSAWDETVSGVPYSGGDASLDLVVGDGQSYDDGELDVNGTPIAGPGAVFNGDTGPNYGGNPSGVTGSLWDVKSFDITSLLSEGSNDLHITSPANADALSLVVAIANVPASGPPVIG